MRHSIPVRQVDDELIQILKEFGIDLPKCRKELIPKENELLEVRDVPNGQYMHFGIENAIQSYNYDFLNKDVVCDFNIDGLPLYKSSRKSIWPINSWLICRQTNNITFRCRGLGRNRSSFISRIVF